MTYNEIERTAKRTTFLGFVSDIDWFYDTHVLHGGEKRTGVTGVVFSGNEDAPESAWSTTERPITIDTEWRVLEIKE